MQKKFQLEQADALMKDLVAASQKTREVASQVVTMWSLDWCWCRQNTKEKRAKTFLYLPPSPRICGSMMTTPPGSEQLQDQISPIFWPQVSAWFQWLWYLGKTFVHGVGLFNTCSAIWSASGIVWRFPMTKMAAFGTFHSSKSLLNYLEACKNTFKYFPRFFY